MSTNNPRGRDQTTLGAGMTPAARLPALSPVRTGNLALDLFLEAVRERLELREGTRGNPFEKVVTQRDLQKLGVVGTQVLLGPSGAVAGLVGQRPDGSFVNLGADAFATSIRDSALYKDLARRLDDTARFDDLPGQLRALLLTNIAEEAAARGADVKRVDQKIQSATESFASAITEVTASVAGAAAGVRETLFAAATANRAQAGKLTQIQARLDGVGGVTVEQALTATADKVTGLEGKYTVKINAGGAVAGFGLSAEENLAGVATSAFIVQADKFAVVAPSYSGGSVADPSSASIPFGVDAAGVYINGNVRINGGGPTVGSLTTATRLHIVATSQFLKVDGAGAPVNTSAVLSVLLTGAIAGNTSNVTWTRSSTATTAVPVPAPAPSGYTVNAADQTPDSVTYTAAITVTGVVYQDSFTVVRLRDGSSALSGVLSNESHNVPADVDGAVSSFAGASTIMKVFKGVVDETSLWAFTKSDAGLTSALTGSGTATVTTTVSALSAEVGTATITATRSGFVSLVKVFTVTKSRVGGTGDQGLPGLASTVAGPRGISSVTKASTKATSGQVDTPELDGALPSLPRQVGDSVTLHNAAATPPWTTTWVWTGILWGGVILYVNGNAVITGTLSAGAIGAGNITAATIDTSGYGQFNGKITKPAMSVFGTFGAALVGEASTFDNTTLRTGVLGVSKAAFSTNYGVIGYAPGGGLSVDYGVGGYGTHAGGHFIGGTYSIKCQGVATFDSAIVSTVAHGTAPFTVASATQVANLNAQYVGGNLPSAFALSGHSHTGFVGSASNITTIGTVSAGTGAANFASTNKPGIASANTWLTIIINGANYYIPVWT